jgi:hypothetical protein
VWQRRGLPLRRVLFNTAIFTVICLPLFGDEHDDDQETCGVWDRHFNNPMKYRKSYALCVMNGHDGIPSQIGKMANLVKAAEFPKDTPLSKPGHLLKPPYG